MAQSEYTIPLILLKMCLPFHPKQKFKSIPVLCDFGFGFFAPFPEAEDRGWEGGSGRIDIGIDVENSVLAVKKRDGF